MGDIEPNSTEIVEVAEEKTEKKTPRKKAVAKPKAKPAKKAHAAKKTAEKHAGHKQTVKVKVDQKSIWLVGLVAVIIIGVILFKGAGKESTSTVTSTITGSVTPTPQAGQVKVDFYVMSQCPYGTQVEDAIKPVLDKLGSAVDFNLDFIAKDNGGGSFQSLHGANEVSGDIVQLCAAKYNPQEYMGMVVCMNKNAGSIPNNWEECAKDGGLSVEKIRSCFAGAEGKSLLSESIKRAEAVKASGSPTIYVGGASYNGGRDTLSFMRALCNKLSNHPQCANMPVCALDSDCPAKEGKIPKCENPGKDNAKCTYVDDPKVDVIVLNDEKCTSCDPTQILATSKQLFPNIAVRKVDVSSDEGKKLISDLGITKVPAYLFADPVTKTNTWATNTNMASFFEKIGGYYKLDDQVTGATHFVNEEAKQVYNTAIGLSPGDNKPQMDFFVMSYCPYGNQAEEIVKAVYDTLGDKAEFKPHYVVYENYAGGGPTYCLANGKYCSMHGIQELNQDIREICVNKYMGIKSYFGFVMAMNRQCSSQNADTCWEAVAKNLSLDTAKIKGCQDKEGLDILAAEKNLNGILGVSGSPTIFVEGEKYGGARTAAGFQAALCAGFDSRPAECGNVVVESSVAVVPSGGCG